MIKKVFYKKDLFFSLYRKIDNKTYYQRKGEKILNKANDYYKNNNETIREHAKYEYKNLSEEDKIKKNNMDKIK